MTTSAIPLVVICRFELSSINDDKRLDSSKFGLLKIFKIDVWPGLYLGV